MTDSLKLVLVGDGTVGKTCLLSVYTSGTFPAKYVPTVIDNLSHDIVVDNRTVRMHLWDTAGQEDYDRLRPLSYPGTQVFLVCFSIDGRSSYQNVRDKWQPELAHYCPGVPMILVGTKTDLRTDQSTIKHLQGLGTTIVSTEEGEALARDIGARKYVECSALMQQGLDAVFQEAVRANFAGQDKRKKKKSKAHGCSLI